MALAETARLIASLELDPRKFQSGIRAAEGSLGKMEGRLGKLGRVAAIGVGAGVGVGVAVIGRGIKAGLDSLAQLESATTSVDAAIQQMGLTGEVTAAQVAGWSAEIEKDVGSAFDDKAILQASTTLIRYGKITTSNLRPALVVMTDLAAKTGSVESASTLLAKALADPEKAAGKLARAGVVLTAEQQDQIKAMVKAGDAAGAQKLLLDALTTATKGAAAASEGPYQRSLSVLRDVTEDAERALAEGFLPVIEKVRDILTRELAKPETIQNIRDFGKGLAGGLDKLVDIATSIPWGSVGDAFRLVGQGSKAALDLFTGLPPWVQTAVLTGWGLNKLTGGALGGIVGELGKGLVKGVLGMNAGVVNINAGVVNGAGGAPGSNPLATAGGLFSTATLASAGTAMAIAFAPVAAAEFVIAMVGKDKILADDLASKIATATARGLDPGKVPTKPREGLSDPFAEWVRGGSKVTPLNTSGSPNDRNQRHQDAVTIAKILDTRTDQLRTKIEDVGAAIQKWKPSAKNQIEDRRLTGLNHMSPDERDEARRLNKATVQAIAQAAILAKLTAQNNAAQLDYRQDQLRGKIEDTGATTKTGLDKTKTALDTIRSKIAVDDSANLTATRSGSSQIVSAIERNGKPVVNVTVNVSPSGSASVYTSNGTASTGRTGSGARRR